MSKSKQEKNFKKFPNGGQILFLDDPNKITGDFAKSMMSGYFRNWGVLNEYQFLFALYAQKFRKIWSKF